MGFSGFRVPVSVIGFIVLTCMCPLVHADARAEDDPSMHPAPGAWSVKTEFGGFDISVDPGFTQIANLAVHLAGYSCGGVSVNGNIQAEGRGMWPIEDKRFQARTSLGIYEIVITGAIGRAGESACGTWSVRTAGTVCSGSWKTD